MTNKKTLLFSFSVSFLTLNHPVIADISSTDDQKIDEIYITTSPLNGSDVDVGTPFHIQHFSQNELSQYPSNSLANFLGNNAAGVSLSQAQNNPLQPDLSIRGFSASPLLGSSPGAVVSINGVRINEPFGDTVNWDLIPTELLDSVSLLSGANANFGLNALGGVLALKTINGFSQNPSSASISSGSFGRSAANILHSGNDGRWGYAVALNGFTEDGWRDYSPSDAYNAYGSLSFKDNRYSFGLTALAGQSELHGNGTSPEELLREDRTAVFTHPDITENNSLLLIAQQQYDLSKGNTKSSLRGNLFFRQNTTDSFNGDGSEFEECETPNDDFLCDEEDELLIDQNNNFIDEGFDAINNRSTREQKSWGGTVEYARALSLFDSVHNGIVGLDFYRGDTDFASSVEIAELNTNRSTTISGIYYPDGATRLDSTIDTKSIYWLDSFSILPSSTVELSLRYTTNKISTRDRSGEAPELTASHRFKKLNWGIGFNHSYDDNLTLYSNIHQSSRTPTPIEFACSHPDAPCTLPNTFLADPPLDDIIARNAELGLRYQNQNNLSWEINSFFTKVYDDIIFQTTGGVSSNEGFFSNATDTQRIGFSGLIEKKINQLTVSVNYSWLRATYKNDFFVSSPNHPNAINDRISVNKNDKLTGIPEHIFNISIEWNMTEKIRWMFDTRMESGVFLRGDEGNLDDKTNSTINSDIISDLAIHYDMTPSISTWINVNNVFDIEKESFGIYGEPDEVIPTLSDENSRFLSPNEPRGIWAGIKIRW
ncbi:MAG: TonB-dependent receptor plug domain-containing protein [Cellvibrionaceae bacterium]